MVGIPCHDKLAYLGQGGNCTGHPSADYRMLLLGGETVRHAGIDVVEFCRPRYSRYRRSTQHARNPADVTLCRGKWRRRLAAGRNCACCGPVSEVYRRLSISTAAHRQRAAGDTDYIRAIGSVAAGNDAAGQQANR